MDTVIIIFSILNTAFGVVNIYSFFRDKCQHVWEIIQKTSVYGTWDQGVTHSKLPVSYEYHLQCTICGTIKTKKAKC